MCAGSFLMLRAVELVTISGSLVTMVPSHIRLVTRTRDTAAITKKNCDHIRFACDHGPKSYQIGHKNPGHSSDNKEEL